MQTPTMQKYLFFILLLSSFTAHADSPEEKNGLITIKSAYSVIETANRFEAILKNKSMTIFNRIDHAEGAKKVGKTLRPTELIIFGNPKIGTELILCSQTIGLDLPQKALFWQDENEHVWLTYNEPKFIAERHNVDNCKNVTIKIKNALEKFALSAAKK